MGMILRNSLALVLTVVVTVGAIAFASSRVEAAEVLSSVQAVSCPAAKLTHWQASTEHEKLTFLFGFVTMLELEREWQGKTPLPIRQSINGSWAKGLAGKTLGDLSGALDDYVAQNPNKLEETVVGTLGRLFVVPEMTDKEKADAKRHYQQIKK